jgi:ribosomal protein S27AE
MNLQAMPATRIENTLKRATCRKCGVTVAMILHREGRPAGRLCGFCREPLTLAGDGGAILRTKAGAMIGA